MSYESTPKYGRISILVVKIITSGVLFRHGTDFENNVAAQTFRQFWLGRANDVYGR